MSKRKLSSSDYIAICALFVSIVGIPLSSWLSYKSANNAFLFQEYEKQIAGAVAAKAELEETATLFGRLFKTVAEDGFGTNLSTNQGLKEFNDKRHEIYAKIYSFGIIEDLKAAMKEFSNTKAVDLLAQSNPGAHESYMALRLHLKNIGMSKSDKVYSSYRTFFEHGTLNAISAIDENQIRDTILQRQNTKAKHRVSSNFNTSLKA